MYTTCRHIMPSGLHCQSPAMRGSAFCYFHGRRIPPRGKRPSTGHRVEIPPTLDRNGISHALHSVLQGLAADRISARRASILLLGLQMAVDHPANRAQVAPTLDLLPAELFRSEGGSDETIAAINAFAEKLGLGSHGAPPRTVSPKA